MRCCPDRNRTQPSVRRHLDTVAVGQNRHLIGFENSAVIAHLGLQDLQHSRVEPFLGFCDGAQSTNLLRSRDRTTDGDSLKEEPPGVELLSGLGCTFLIQRIMGYTDSVFPLPQPVILNKH